MDIVYDIALIMGTLVGRIRVLSVVSLLLCAFYIDAFKIYWNVPSLACYQNHQVLIIPQRYGITANYGTKFIGEEISIMYNPGYFPYFYGSTPRNGGIPQKAKLRRHVENFHYSIQKNFPDQYSGLIVLDFEAYEPIYASSKSIYRIESQKLARKEHPSYNETEVEEEAERAFNSSSKVLFKILLDEGKRLRPNAKWGYYGFPKCRNSSPHNAQCNPEDVEHSIANLWQFESSGAFFPSVYAFYAGWNRTSIHLQVREKYRETEQIRSLLADEVQKPILPYFWFRYHDHDEYLSVEHIFAVLGTLKDEGADGAVIWGGSNQFDTKEKCLKFQEYFYTYLGPISGFLIGYH